MAEENKINLNLDFESIVPWNGQQDTGRDVRLKLDRNWKKIVDAFNTLLNGEFLDDKYLRKDKDDRSVGTIASDKGFLVGNADRGMSIDPETNIVTAVLDRLMEVLNIQSQEFAMGEWGNGFILKYDKKTGQSYFEVDRMLVRKVAYFVELIIKQLSHVGGQLVLSPASMRCSRVEEYGEYYRCYFENERDGKTINNEFKVGDQARAQSFNVKEGTNHNVSSQYYWRLVVGVGDNYIDLSKIDCDAGSLPPLAGDDIVQLGNRTDPERQNAIILSTVGEDAPSFKQYEGIQYYTLAGKEVTIISPKRNVITGDFLSKSGKDLLGYIDDLGARLDDVQYQTDKHYTIWFYDYNPTLENYPASEWMDDDAKRQHVQDIFYNEEEGLAFRFLEVSEGVFVWNDITDHETIKALEKAAKAQKTADGKIRNFVAQPVPPYDEGDRWSNASYTSDDGTVLYDNDDLVCVTSKAEGEVFDIADWQPTSGQDSAFKKKFYSEVARLDERITLSVGEGSTTAEAIKNAQAAAKAASDAAATAQNTANTAQNTANAAQNTANAADKRSTNNASAISVQANSISLLNGAFADVNGQKVLTSAAGATILSDVAKIYATSEGVTAALETKVSFDPKTSKVTSNIVLSADQIDLNGAVTANKTFKIDTSGYMTCVGGTIAGFSISDKYITGGDSVKMTLNTDDGGYPSIKWAASSKVYASLGMNVGTYMSGQLDLKDNNTDGAQSVSINPGTAVFNGNNYEIQLSAGVNDLSGNALPALKVKKTSYNQYVTLGLNSSGKVSFYATSWPTASKDVSVGEVWLDGTTLRVRTS